MSLPLTHAGLSAPGISAALDLKFASTLSLTSSSGITPSFSRASSGTFFNSSGVLTTAAVNAPRFDHTFNGTSWISRGLLVEEQRTNLAQYSEDMTNVFWAKSTCTITANDTTAPDGNATADKIIENTGTVSPGIYTQTGISFTNGTTYTASAYVKANGRSVLGLYFQSSAHPAAGRIAWFDISNGTTQVQSGVVATLTNVGNGWYRITTTATANATAASGFGLLVFPAMGSISGYTGDGSSGFFAWGLGCEAGSFPTSYIPTTSASVTRSADVCQITGSDFTSFWNASEGSFAVEYDSASPVGSTTIAYPVVTFSDLATNNKRIWYTGEGGLAGNRFYVFDGASSTTVLILPPIAGGSIPTRASAGWKINDVAASLNGGSCYLSASQIIPTGIDILRIGNNPASGNQMCGHIARLRYFNKRLTDKQLEDLCKPEEQLKLDLKFSENLSLTPVVGPTPSFSRASTGSYFDSAGVLRYAPVNLALYSEDFSNAYWIKTNATVTANAIASPDGKITADKISEDSSSGKHRVYAIPLGQNLAIYTLSVYAKSAERSWLAINWADISGDQYTYFDLSSGAIGSVVAGGTAQVQNVGNGWYRCSVTKSNLATNTNFDFGPTTANNFVPNYAGTTGSGIYIWGAQLEASSTVGTYVPTTSAANSAPRFDHTYDGTNWISRGLLVEEQRTNLCTYSEQLGQASWNFLTNITVSSDASAAPDGTITADLIYPTASGANCEIGKAVGTVSLSPVIYTNSYYLKSSGKIWARILSIRGDFGAWFNLSNGTIGTTLSGSVATIQNVGNGWYRCTVARTTDFSTGYTFVKISDSDNSNTVTASGTDGILVWGAQVESGAFPTSYIGTTNSSVTRSADVCQITGTDFSGFWNQGEGSVAFEYDLSGPIGDRGVCCADDSADARRIAYYGNLGSAPNTGKNGIVMVNTSLQAYLGVSTVIYNTPIKFAACYRLNDVVAYSGSDTASDTSCTIPTVSTFRIGAGYWTGGLDPINGHIARLRYYSIRLPNRLLIAKST